MTTATQSSSQAPAPPSFAHRVSSLVRDCGSLARDHFELAALEAKLAAIGIVKVTVGAVLASILVVTAWLSFVASAIVWATHAGISWPAALCIGGAVNLVLALIIVLWMRAQASHWGFEATVRQLRRTAEEARPDAS